MITHNKTIIRILFTTLIFSTLLSCEKAFEFSPFQLDIDPNKKGTNALQIKELQKNDDGSSKVTFASISDIHYHYTSLSKIVDHINSDPEIEFVVAVGDITDQGLQKEFELFYNIMDDLNKPYITIIGNHDYQSNGEHVYHEMYGLMNFDFTYKNAHFIGFDDTFWENDNSIPDFDWLDKTTSAYESNNYQVVIAHLPPFSDQFTPETEEIYTNIINKNKVNLSLHGHTHGFYYGNYYEDSIAYLVNQWPKTPVYTKVTIENNKLKVQKIEL